MISTVFSIVVITLFAMTSTFGMDDIDKLTGVDLEYMIGLCKLLSDQGYLNDMKKEECNKKNTLDLIDLAIEANVYAKQKHPETASDRDVNIAFLKNASKKWILANLNQPSRLPSTPKPNQHVESSESDSDESDGSDEISKEIPSSSGRPSSGAFSGKIEQIDKNFMLHYCKGLKEFAFINGIMEDQFNQLNIIQLIDLAIQANQYAKQQDVTTIDEVKDKNIEFLQSIREQWAKKRPDLLPKPDQQKPAKPGNLKPVQSANDRLPSRPHLSTGSAMKPARPASQSHHQLASLSAGSSNQGFGRPSSSKPSNSRPKPTAQLNEYSHEDDSHETSFSQGHSQNKPSPNGRPRPRPGSQQNHHANSMAKPGRRPPVRPSRQPPNRRPTRRPIKPRPQYPSYHEDEYSDYNHPDDEYQQDYDNHHYEDDEYTDQYHDEEYAEEYDDEHEYPSKPVTSRPRPTRSPGLLSQLVGFVGKLL